MRRETVLSLFRTFEEHKLSVGGIPFWPAISLKELLGCQGPGEFSKYLSRARIYCESAGESLSSHFVPPLPPESVNEQTQPPGEEVLLLSYFACRMIAELAPDELTAACTLREKHLAILPRP